MPLGTFTLKARGKAGSYDPRLHVGKPLIVVPREFRSGFTTQRFPNPKDVVIVDIVDLLADTVHVSVIWGSGAIVDAVKDHVPTDGSEPTKLPVKIEQVTSAAGNLYTTLVPLDGAALQLAGAWDAKYPTRVDAERQNHESAQLAQAGQPAVDPMAAALAALQGAPAQAQPAPQVIHSQAVAQPVGGGDPQVAALQAQLAAALAAQSAPVQETPAQPAMSDADLEAAIAALK